MVIVFGGGINIGVSILGGYNNLQLSINQKLIGITVILVILLLLVFWGPRIINYSIKRLVIREKSIELPVTHIRSMDVAWWSILEAMVLIFATGVGYFLLKTIAPKQNPPFFLLAGSFNLGVVLSPISMWLPGNAGVRDGLVYIALRPVLGDELSALTALTWRIWGYILEAAAGIICGIDLKRRLTNLNIQLIKDDI